MSNDLVKTGEQLSNVVLLVVVLNPHENDASHHFCRAFNGPV